MTSGAPPAGRGLRDVRARNVVLGAVRRCYAEGRRLDMQALAAETGVSRATIYRRLGSRETLLGIVLAAEGEQLVRRVREEVGGHGAAALLETCRRINAHLAQAERLRRFLVLERETGVRIITSSGGHVQPRMVAAVAALLRAETQAGTWASPVEADTLAFALVRLTEAFIYQDAVAGIREDVDRLVPVQALLLGA